MLPWVCFKCEDPKSSFIVLSVPPTHPPETDPEADNGASDDKVQSPKGWCSTSIFVGGKGIYYFHLLSTFQSNKFHLQPFIFQARIWKSSFRFHIPEDEPNSLRPWGRGAGDGEGKILLQPPPEIMLVYHLKLCVCVHVRTRWHPPDPPMLKWSGERYVQRNDKWHVLMARQSYFLPGPVLQAITQRCRVTPPAAANHEWNQRKLRRCHSHFSSHVSWPVYPQFPSIRFVVGCFIPSLFHSFFYLCSGQVNVFLFYTLVYMFVLICTCVCVCVFACLHLDHFLCFQIQAYPARLRGPTNSKCFLSILTKLENLRAIDLSEIPTKRWSPSRQSPAGTKCLLSYREVCSGDSGAAKWMVQNWGGHQPFVINEIYI